MQGSWNRRLWTALVGLGILVMPAALAEVSATHQDEVQGLLYRVEGNGGRLYVLGSIHIGSGVMYPFGTQLVQAMEEADVLVFECDTTSKDAVAAAREMMYYQDDTLLQDVLPTALYDKLSKVCKEKGYAMKTFRRMKPWAVMNSLSLETTAAEMGMDSLREATAYGVEAHLRAYGEETGKAVAYVETTREQLAMMDGFSMPLQLYLLEEAVDIILNPAMAVGLDSDMNRWPLWWRQGNAQAFADSFWAGYAAAANNALLDEYYDALIYRRNATIAQRLDEWLQAEAGHTYFVTLGLLHVVLPEDSVVAHLQQRGYQVERLGGM